MFRVSCVAPTQQFQHSRWYSVFIILLLFSIIETLRAQSTASPPQSQQPPSTQSPSDKAAEIPPVALYVMLNRKSIVFPDIAADSDRLPTARKFELFIDNSISLNALTGAAFGSGLAQAADKPRGYGQGGDGYAKRFGSSMARQASSNFFGTFLLASALHQDPRFFPKNEPSFRRRIRYSLERVVITRSDDGRDVKNWSGLLGPLLSESLANAYWPEQDRTAGQTFGRYGIDLAVRAGTNMLREYWPWLIARVPGIRPSGKQ